MKSGQSRANQNRAVRREELRRYLSERGKIQYIFDSVEKLENFDTELSTEEIARLKAAIDTRVKMTSKYLPDIKSIELSEGDDLDLSEAELDQRIAELTGKA